MMTIRWHGRNNGTFGMMHNVTDVSRKQQPGIVIYRPQDATGASHRRLTDAGCRLRIVEADENLDRALDEAGPVHALLVASLRGTRLDRARLQSLPELRIVAKYTIGVDDVDVDAATESAILVTHCPTEANWGGVAEGTVAFMLSLLKKLQIRDARVRAGGWRSDALQGTYLGARADGYPGITLGIVGLGRIGRRLAELMAPWKIRLLATDPYVDDGVFERCGAERVSLDVLLSESDVVSIHCTLTSETEGLIDRAGLRLMKPGALLINTARGRIVDVDAVCDALDAGRLGGAAFDVLPEEPPANDARILATDERVILSPHMVAANRGGTLGAAVPWATDAVLDALGGKVPPHVYNESVIAAWEARFAGRSLLGI
jgi:phosphoglycerate dehydrogenase-like enzyme